MAGKRFKITTRDPSDLTGKSCGFDFEDGVCTVDIADGDIRADQGLQNAKSIHGCRVEVLGVIDDDGDFTAKKKKKAEEKKPEEKPTAKKDEGKK
ncbi:hypothetical protein LCGC14_0401580 [marine sediment metagenome]|uniref:Uncharacterized protein n=1 Tax=marine sediment metagenome TaxID=412755 RepID=A0A0F9SWS6_9ZZZZ